MSFLCAKGFPKEKLVLVAMHHTFDPDYILPDNRNLEQFELSVDCLFFEKTGLYKCPRNKKAIKKICKTVITQVKHYYCVLLPL